MKNRKFKNATALMLTLIIILSSAEFICADEQTATYGYEFYDGSSDEWGSSIIAEISESYALTVIDFDTLKESKSETYESIGEDISEISASDLYSSAGEIIDIGVDYIYIVSLSETAETYYTINIEDITLMTLYMAETEITVTEADDGILTLDTGSGTPGVPITNEDEELVAIVITEDTAMSVAYLYDSIKDYLPAEETEEELDFTTLKSLIEQAKGIDTDDYDDTSEFETAFNDAKTVCLNATTQEEINSAALALSAAISGLYAETAPQNALLSLLTESSDFMILIAVIIAIAVILLILIITFSKKKKNKEKDTEKISKKTSKNTNEFDEIEYETGYEDTSQSSFPFQYETDERQLQTHERQKIFEDRSWTQNDDEDDIPTTMLDAAFLIRKNTGEKIPITKNGFTVGRSTADYRIADNPTVGRLHCAFYRQNNDYYIEDRNSTNGTFINKERINVKTLLHDGDIIRLANEEFDYRQPNQFAEYEDRNASATAQRKEDACQYAEEYKEYEETDAHTVRKEADIRPAKENASRSEYSYNRSSSNRRRNVSNTASTRESAENVQNTKNPSQQQTASASNAANNTYDEDDLYY